MHRAPKRRRTVLLTRTVTTLLVLAAGYGLFALVGFLGLLGSDEGADRASEDPALSAKAANAKGSNAKGTSVPERTPAAVGRPESVGTVTIALAGDVHFHARTASRLTAG